LSVREAAEALANNQIFFKNKQAGLLSPTYPQKKKNNMTMLF